MYKASGVGLAAPQVGHSIRLIVVDVTSEEDAERKPYHIFNPVVSEERRCAWPRKGCLSIPGVWADVERPESSP